MAFQKGVRQPIDSYLPEQIQIIRDLYPKIPAKWVAALLRRPVGGVMRKANLLGLRGHKSTGNWNRQELKTLQEAWGHSKVRTLRAKLPGRTWIAIKAKAIELGLGPRFRGCVTISQAADLIGCYPETVKVILRTEGVELRVKVAGRKRPTWVAEPDDVLEAAKRYYRRESALAFSERAGLSRWALDDFLADQNLRGVGRKVRRHFLLPEEWNDRYANYLKSKEGKRNGLRREEAGTGPGEERDGSGDRR